MVPGVSRGNKNLGDRVKILLADDSVTMHRAVKLALKNEPYEVLTCDNGQDALRLALEHNPKIVLADLDMPLMTGAEVAVAIKKNPLLQGIKIVLLCGSFDQVDESKLGSIPTDGRIWKPFEAHTLVAMLKTLVEKGGATHDSSTIRESSAPTGTLPPPSKVHASSLATSEARARLAPEVTSPELERGLTEETFQEATKSSTEINSEELPTRTRDVDPLYTPSRDKQDAESQNESSLLEAASHAEAKENLWTDDYRAEDIKKDQKANLESAGSAESTRWEMPEAKIPAPGSSEQFEIVTSNLNLDQAELPPSDRIPEYGMNTPEEVASSQPVPQLFKEDEWVRDRDFTDYQTGSSGIHEHQLDESSSSKKRFTADDSQVKNVSKETIRKIIQDELQDTLKGILKEVLQEELSKVLAEIERD